MADKLILAETGKALVSIATPLHSNNRGIITTMDGTQTLVCSSNRSVTLRYLTWYAIGTVMSDINTRHAGNTIEAPTPRLRITPSLSTEIENGYFADLTPLTNSGLTHVITLIPDSKGYQFAITYNNNSEETVTINSLALTMTNDDSYNGSYTTYTPRQIIAGQMYSRMAIVSLLVLEEPIVLEPGQSETRTITYDLSNV